ncbi:NlpC/P60 family protein [Streptomyces sp. NPDC091292]|uniref:C40 family peptidase n=1 Tax=Streptomyces sp. NPDC091292 TaxID=3365991 RepID=UPI0038060FAD
MRTQGQRAATVVALACALTATTQQGAHADPETLTEVRARLQRLYHDAGVATDKYNGAGEKVTAQKKRVAKLDARVDATEKELTRLTSLAGAAARAQYRGGSLPAELQFALADDPGHALDNAGRTLQAQEATRDVITGLAAAHEDLRTQTTDAAGELKRLEASRRERAAERKKILRNIDAAEQLESRLAEPERLRLVALDDQEAREAQAKWVDTGILKKVGTKTTRAGLKAIAYATRQIGKPYIWGAAGPSSFDCSGLTSQAWLAAGVPIPRTSQEQWRRLPRVPVEEMRPGDLVIYFADASHVALYVGEGQIIHSPRPGRTVTVAPAGSMAILGVVRPGG